MKRSVVVIGLIAAIGVGAGAYYMRRNGGNGSEGVQAGTGGRGGAPQAGPGGFGRAAPRLPMTVELGSVKRADMSQQITVVGNLIGAATVAAAPKVNGRLEAVLVRMGDRVTRGQTLARIEDSEIQEQVKQAEASYAVAAATIRQREADLRFAQTNLDRSMNLFERQLVPKQTLDDAEARHQAAAAQLDLAQAQYAQTGARLDELKINLANTVIASPVNGFVGSRTLDPGAWVTPNTAFISVVDIGVVRMVANVVERDLRRVAVGFPADVEVDAYPGEKFAGQVAHVAPVLDPATRTAQVEVAIQNSSNRLKPGMYARVSFTVDRRDNALVVPANAVVDLSGNRGVFQPAEGDVAKFKQIETGLIDQNLIEVVSGLTEGEQIVTTGAAALREGDRIVPLGQGADGETTASGARGDGGGRQGGRGASPGNGPSGQPPVVNRGGRS
jgi:HlyD family secretion protein